MEDKIHRIGQLIIAYLRDELTEEERTELQQWIAEDDEQRQQYLDIKEWLTKFSNYSYSIDDERKEKGWDRIVRELALQEAPVRTMSRRRWWYAVAAVAIAVIAGTYMWMKPVKKIDVAETPVNDIAPGGNKATLTLSDGTTILLDNTANGKLETEKNVLVTKSDGRLEYDTTHSMAVVVQHELKTPPKGLFSVRLPDGSVVTLNAVTTLRYPSAFTGNSREVEVSGEAFFDVAKDESKPFRVTIKSATGSTLSQVEVLGTAFNVMAYADEDLIKTTLLHGAVRLSNTNSSVLLKPGNKGVIERSNTAGRIVVTRADIELETAWREGIIKLEGADIQTIMRQLARWYDVEVVYEGKVPDIRLQGTINRNINLSEVLDVLEFTAGLHYRREGKKIIVMP